MIKCDLITGFLGSGKTTFIKKYADYLIRSGRKIAILENDFGAVNVDMLLLQDMLGDACELEPVAGATDKCCHRRRFKTKLISLGMRGFDRVIVEPSGIFDTDEFFDILREEPLDRWYEIGNVITIADAGLDDDLSEASDYMLASQAANAGVIVLSRVQEVNADDIARTKAHLDMAFAACKCRKRERRIIEKPWDELTDKDFESIADCGYEPDSYEKLWFDQDKAYGSEYFMNVHMSGEKLMEAASRLFEDAECGRVFRIKGFVPSGDGWLELNATRREAVMKEIAVGQEIIIVIGEELNREEIEKYFK